MRHLRSGDLKTELLSKFMQFCNCRRPCYFLTSFMSNGNLNNMEFSVSFVIPSAEAPFGLCAVYCYTIVKGKGNIVPAHAIKAYGGSKDISPLILNVGSRCMCVHSFKLKPL